MTTNGQYIHQESGLLFNPQSKRVYAKLLPSGVFHHLTRADIDRCIEMGLSYDLPENLDLGSVKIVDKKLEEELNEEDFKDEPDEEDEEEEGGGSDHE